VLPESRIPGHPGEILQAFDTTPEFWISLQTNHDLAVNRPGKEYDPGSGNYTEERRILLPDWDAATLIQKAKELQKPRESDT
jgi:hypothetical protein